MKKFILCVLLMLPVVSMSQNADVYLGRWIHVKYKDYRLEVSQNGSGYLISELRGRAIRKIPASFKDSSLEVSVGPRTAMVVIEQKSGHLIFNGQEYRKLAPGESFEYKEPAVPRF